GAFYVPGFSHLPGAFLCLAALALATSGLYGWSGAAIGTLFFTKIIMAPITLCSVLAFLWMSSRFAKVKKVAIGIAAALLVGLVIIYERDELNGFFDALYANVLYSQGNLVRGNSPVQKVASHLLVVLNANAIVTLVATCGCLL